MTFFFRNRVNIGCGRAEERFLLTGLHAVADIFCSSCKTTLGWKYVSGSRMVANARPNANIMEGRGVGNLGIKERRKAYVGMSLWV